MCGLALLLKKKKNEKKYTINSNDTKNRTECAVTRTFCFKKDNLSKKEKQRAKKLKEAIKSKLFSIQKSILKLSHWHCRSSNQIF